MHLLPNGGITGISGINGNSVESPPPVITGFDLRVGPDSMLNFAAEPIEDGQQIYNWFDGSVQFKKTDDFEGGRFYDLELGVGNAGDRSALIGPDVAIPINTKTQVIYVHCHITVNPFDFVVFGNNKARGGVVIAPYQFSLFDHKGKLLFNEKGPTPGEGEKLIRITLEDGNPRMEWTLKDADTTVVDEGIDFTQPLVINTIFARSTDGSELDAFGTDGGHTVKAITILDAQSDEYEMETIGCLIDGDENNITSIVDSGQGNIMLNCEGALRTINVDDWIQIVDSKIETYNNFFRVTDDPNVYLFHFALTGSTYTVDEANVGATWSHETETNIVQLIDQDDDGVFVRSGKRHELSGGDSVTIEGTTDYDDLFEVSAIKNLGTFYIDTPFVSKITTGLWSKYVAPVDPTTLVGCILDLHYSEGTYKGNSVSPTPATTGDYIFRWTNRATSAIGAADARILFAGDDQTATFDLFRLGDTGVDQFGDPGEDYNKISLLWVAPITFNRVSFDLLRATGWTCYCRLDVPEILGEQVRPLTCSITDGPMFNINIQKISDSPRIHRIKFEASDDSDFDFAVELQDIASTVTIRWRVSPVDNLMRLRVEGFDEFVGGDVQYNYSTCQGLYGNFNLTSSYSINRLVVFNALDVVNTYGQETDDAIFAELGAG